MKPVRLALSCVGPYVQPVDVDFGRLGEVFLVCGPTGSGKTTLFDAMVYALYGQVPGTRDPSDLVSHHAADSGEVFVDFSFSIGAETWRVLRRPARTIAKRRGEGNRLLPSEAVLYHLRRPGSPGGQSGLGQMLPGIQDPGIEPDRAGLPGAEWETVRDKPGEVTEKIEGMLGLSFDEFTRIILLPQGEFQRFLDMNTGDRTEILEKLFPVDAHAAVSELARKAAGEARAEAKAADEAIASLAAGLGPEPDAALEAAKARASQAMAGEESARSLLMAARLALESARMVSKAWDELSEAETEHNRRLALQGEMSSLGLRLDRAAAAAGIRNEIEAGDRALAQRKREAVLQENLGIQVQTLKAREAEMDQTRLALAGLSDAIAAMDREAGDLASRAAAWERARVAAQACAAAGIEVAEAEKAAALGRGRLRSLEADLAALELELPDRPSLSDSLSLATADRESARLVLARADEARVLGTESGRVDAGLQTAAEELKESIARLKAAELQVAEAEARQAEASIPALAAGLLPGKPCPVCGSLDHPLPAARSSRKDLGHEDERAALDKARAALRLAERESAEAGSRLGSLEQSRAELALRLSSFGELPDPEEAARLLAAAEAALDRFRTALREADAKAAAVASTRKELEAARQLGLADEARLSAAVQVLASARAAAYEAGQTAGDSDPSAALTTLRTRRQVSTERKAALEKALTNWEAELAAAESRLADCEARLAQANDDFSLASEKAAKALARVGFQDREAWEAACMDKDEHAALAVQTADYANSVAASAARLAAARRATDGSARPDVALLQLAASEAEEVQALARAALSRAEAELGSLQSAFTALASARTRREALRERGDRLVELAGLLNGETAGRRLSFRNFVLARYFSRVAQRASVRLREMSEGRYDIRVVEGKSRGQGRIGLDLEVMDSFTGRSRPASSLSGGEKFLSSISLALGLSDVITRRSGGIALDSIFIDEGFGSLDDETLDRAVAVLDRIRGQRMIGIVSHVAELRTRIPARIEVDKTGSGSTLRIIGG